MHPKNLAIIAVSTLIMQGAQTWLPAQVIVDNLSETVAGAPNVFHDQTMTPQIEWFAQAFTMPAGLYQVTSVIAPVGNVFGGTQNTDFAVVADLE